MILPCCETDINFLPTDRHATAFERDTHNDMLCLHTQIRDILSSLPRIGPFICIAIWFEYVTMRVKDVQSSGSQHTTPFPTELLDGNHGEARDCYPPSFIDGNTELTDMPKITKGA